MRSIYKSSQIVYSWLGNPFPDSDVAFDTLGILSHEIFDWVMSGYPLEQNVDWLNKYPKLCNLDRNSNEGIGNSAWNSLAVFTHLEYWQRIWIFQ
jgi:hypothetical protein